MTKPLPEHSSSTFYRPDIDGLRAISVVSVVLYHSGLRIISGGYVGVDIFYVISGFLITSIIASDLSRERFSIVRFYIRRIRRIFPALMAMAICTSIAAWFLLMPIDFKEYGESLAAMSIFGSNIYFYVKSGYFDQQAELRPLLHTWSLAVEEQYYAFFPIMLIVLYKINKKLVPVSCVLIWTISLVLSLYEVRANPSGAFYLIWFRAWEILSGAIVALGVIPAVEGRKTSEALSVVGLALMLAPIFLYDKNTPFPGGAAVPVVVGAVLIIFAGVKNVTFVSKTLSLRPLVFVGLISYSIYLWHWPIFVFAKYVQISALSQREGLILSLAALVMGYLSWRYIEPLRDWAPKRVVPVFVAASSCVVICLGFGIAARIGHGLPSRLPGDVARIGIAALDINPNRRSCDDRSPAQLDRDDACTIGDPTGPITFAVVGDSFADALSPGIDAMARQAGRRGYVMTKGGCTPLLGVNEVSANCPGFMGSAINLILRHPTVTSVILVGRWTTVSEGTRFGADSTTEMYVWDSSTHHRSYSENRQVLKRGLERDLIALAPRKIFIAAFIPEQTVNIPRTMAIMKYFGDSRDVSVDRRSFDRRQEFVRTLLRTIGEKYPFTVIDIGASLCDSRECAASKDGVPLYVDDDHLSRTAAIRLKTAFSAAF